MEYQQKLEDAIIAAHEAGDVEGAQVLANELKTWKPARNLEAKPSLTRMQRFTQGLKDPIDAGAQLLSNIVPDSVEIGVNKLNNVIADKTGLLPKLPKGGVNQQIAEQEQEYKGKLGDVGFDAYRMGGNLLSPANLAIASKIPSGATAMQRLASGGAGGAGLSVATMPVSDANANYGEEKLKQAGLGAVGGAVGQKIAGGISRLISPKASVNPNLTMLKKEGVTPTIGQTLGGGWNRAEEALGSIPVLGSMVSKARNNANVQFEAATHNRALAPIGDKLPDGISGRDAINYTESALKQNYDRVLTNIGAIKPDDKFNTSLLSLTKKVDGMLIPKADKLKYHAALKDIKTATDDNGYITSDMYKSLEGQLGSDAATLGRSPNIYDTKLSPAVKQLQQELKEMLERQAGGSAKELQATNKGWANFKRVQKTSAALGAEDGAFTPAQFQNSVKALDKSKDKGAFARGSALGQDLGDAGKAVLGNKVRDSGTTERAILNLGGLSGMFLEPATAASVLGGSALYTSQMQGLLRGAVSSRPDFAAPSAEFLRNNSKYLFPALGAGLLNQ
ncbi:MAG: hypothetical protein V4605_09515 [Pseudomonadota bacterium]